MVSNQKLASKRLRRPKVLLEYQDLKKRPIKTAITIQYLSGVGLMLLSMKKPSNVWLRALSTGLLLASAVLTPLALIYRVVYPFKRERSREVA